MKRSDFRYKINFGGNYEPHYEIDIWFHNIKVVDRAFSFEPVTDEDVEFTIKHLMENPDEKMVEIMKQIRENKLERINK
jgi:hypothetical protein